MKRVLCGYLKNILTGDPRLVEKQKQEMKSKGQKLHYRKDYYDADWQIRINEIVNGKRAVTADTALRLAKIFGIN